MVAGQHGRTRRAHINTNDRLLLELVAAETQRAGKLHASIRTIAIWLNLPKNTAQRRVTALLERQLIARHSKGSMYESASYTLTTEGLAALQGLQAPMAWTHQAHDSGVDTERIGTWYKDVPVPDAMRRLRGSWELWRSLPHDMWFTPEDVLPYVTATTTRSVRNWTKALVGLEIPLAEWATAGTQFRLLDADPDVFTQLRHVQEDESAQQGRILRSRADLARSFQIERTRADEALENRGSRP